MTRAMPPAQMAPPDGLKVRGETAQELARARRCAEYAQGPAPEGAMTSSGPGRLPRTTMSHLPALVVAGAGSPSPSTATAPSPPGPARPTCWRGSHGLELPGREARASVARGQRLLPDGAAPSQRLFMRNVAGPPERARAPPHHLQSPGPDVEPGAVKRQLVGVFDRRGLRPVAEGWRAGT